MEARLADATAYLAELQAAVELQKAKGKSVRIARMAANAKLPPASVEKKRGRFPIRAHEELTDDHTILSLHIHVSRTRTIRARRRYPSLSSALQHAIDSIHFELWPQSARMYSSSPVESNHINQDACYVYSLLASIQQGKGIVVWLAHL